MPDLNRLFLDTFPEAAVLATQDEILAVNLMARHYLPELSPGAPVPPYIPLSQAFPASGTFVFGMSAYTFSVTQFPEGLLVLFRPAPQTALTDTQLDGALRQLRTFMESFLLEANQYSAEIRASFSKNFHRMFRLVDNLEFMQLANSPGGLPFAPTSIDLVSLCRSVLDNAAPLLLEREISLDFQSSLPTLLIPGDPNLLERLLLELISNAAQAITRGGIVVRLYSHGNRALLSLSGDGEPPSPRQIVSMLQQDADHLLPTPGAGAGLGLSIVRHIAAIHKGALLVELGPAAPSVVLSLPTGPLRHRKTVSTPPLQRDGGLSPLLTALADVLPTSVFELTDLD